LHVDEKGFINFLKLSFGQKRKTLWNNLKGRYPSDNLERALAKAKVKPSVRAETLSLEASASVFRELAAPNSSTSE
jgi:16S rRNA (adenine1518-N6/adenine1519-N6)-dimethyltransferase